LVLGVFLVAVLVARSHAPPPPGAAPNHAPFGDSVERWRPLSREAAITAERLTGISLDEDLVLALIAVESGGESSARSARGTVGLAQVEPATFADLRARYPGVLSDPLSDDASIGEPRTNLIAGALYLAECARAFGADLSDPYDLAVTLHAYQLGRHATAEALRGGGWLPADALDQVARIMALYRAARPSALPKEPAMSP
jgi:soluble lytic murein transglycosylase-like protein